jgi:hypothetical protein
MKYKIIAEHVEQYLYVVEADSPEEAAQKLYDNDFEWDDSVDQGDHVVRYLDPMTDEEIEDEYPSGDGPDTEWTGIHSGDHKIVKL